MAGIKKYAALAVLCGFSIAGCDAALLPTPGGIAPPIIDETDAIKGLPGESQVLSDYYARVQNGLITQGLLRQDGGGPDVPFSSRNLADNFVRIALFEEYALVGGRIVARQTASPLHRWESPIRMRVEFGATIPTQQRVTDRTNITNYAARLSRITGLSIRQSTSDVNYHVFVVNEAERQALGPRIRQILPGISAAAVKAVVDMPRSTFCLVFAWDPNDAGTYEKAVAVIRGEHPDLMRLSCIHEELAQGLGLSNDSPAARPSVFNDDEEFGLLTAHDELLLQILYDRRMRTGMLADEAEKMAAVIAVELLGGES
ncbi:MAG: DUF2927 domain-containing protein [Marinosulfonomonas sp.]|nr:DUF2927 domain-containing protein [Marinosulfonomonas sp.]